MNTMKRILAAALVAAALGGGLGTAMDAMKVRGCKPGIHPKSSETADHSHRRRCSCTPVGAVRG